MNFSFCMGVYSFDKNEPSMLDSILSWCIKALVMWQRIRLCGYFFVYSAAKLRGISYSIKIASIFSKKK